MAAYRSTGNIDVIRNMSGGGDSPSSAVDRALQPPSSTFQRGIVVDVFTDPSIYDDVALDNIRASITNPAHLDNAPRNSILVRPISGGRGRAQTESMICYPFFSSHLCAPLKPGETVWYVFENAESKDTLAFWFSRICEPDHVEDVNYTHGDRRYDTTSSRERTADKITKESSTGYQFHPPRFPNGALDSTDAPTLGIEAKSDDPFEKIVSKAKSTKLHVTEPVPRFTRMPGDMTIQGSNNTLINLGIERGYTQEKRPAKSPTSSISSQQSTSSGAIDIVAGRGRFYGDTSRYDGKTAEDTGQPTAPRVVKNSRKQLETDKNPASNKDLSKKLKNGNRSAQPAEGDPDFVSDAARVYVTQNSKIDDMFGLKADVLPKTFDTTLIDSVGTAAIVVKADDVRIVARKKKKDDPVGSDEINGSIRIVKEGNKNEDMATILLLPDGTVQISGSKIFIGRTKDDGGSAGGPGPGQSQPYVKYQQLEDLLTATFDNIKSFAKSLQEDFLNNTTPGFGAPNPALIKAANAECLKLQKDMDTRKKEIEKLKSQRIFGE